jgi:hypothetical protein
LIRSHGALSPAVSKLARRIKRLKLDEKIGFSVGFGRQVPAGLFIFCLPHNKRASEASTRVARNEGLALRLFPLIGLTGQVEKCFGLGNRSENKDEVT